MFFALSAFLFTKLLVTEYQKTQTINLKKFYIRRIFRIWPLYFLFISLSLALYIWLGGHFSNDVRLRVIGLFAFSDNIMAAIHGYNIFPYSAHLWTIAYEEQFYILIPILILYLVRKSFKIKLIFFITVLVSFNIIRLIMITNNVNHPAIWVLPVTHFESTVLGMVIGFGMLDLFANKMNSMITGLIGIFCFLLLCLLPNVDIISYALVISYSLVGLSTTMILISVMKSDVLKKFFQKTGWFF